MMGSQPPSLCRRHWGIHHPQEKQQARLQLHPRGSQAAVWGRVGPTAVPSSAPKVEEWER